MTKFKIKYVKPSDELLDFEDYFEIPYDVFITLSPEEQKILEKEVTNSFHERYVDIEQVVYVNESEDYVIKKSDK